MTRPLLGSYETPISPTIHPVIEHLIRARRERNMSQAALAERLSVTQACISRWEGGSNDPGLRDVARWAAVFALDIAAIEPVVLDGPLAELVAGGLA